MGITDSDINLVLSPVVAAARYGERGSNFLGRRARSERLRLYSHRPSHDTDNWRCHRNPGQYMFRPLRNFEAHPEFIS